MNAPESPVNFSRSAQLFDLLVGVVQRCEPEVAAVLREERTTAGMPAALLARTLQALPAIPAAAGAAPQDAQRGQPHTRCACCARTGPRAARSCAPHC